MLKMYLFVLLIILTTYANYAHAEDASHFPQAFVETAKKLNCTPKRDQPFIWGVLKNGKQHDSGAFRCETDADRKRYKLASIAIYIREGSGIKFSCPRLIPKQGYGEKFRVWEPGENGTKPMPLSDFQIMGSAKFDKAQMGPKNIFVKGYVLEHQIAEALGVHFYCHGSKWLASYYE